MISRLLSIAAVSLIVAAGPAVAFAAEDAALVREVQGLLIKRGYLKDYHKEWDQCSQLRRGGFSLRQGRDGNGARTPRHCAGAEEGARRCASECW